MMPRHEGVRAVIYGDESAFRVKMHVDALPALAPTAPRAHRQKQTSHDAMTSLVKVKEVKVPDDLMPSHDMYKHIKAEL